MTAMSSMRLFVVCASPPQSSFSWSLKRRTIPHPPGPGLPRHAPSLKTSTTSSLMVVVVAVRPLRERRQSPAACALLAPRRCDEAHAVHPLHRAHHVNTARDRPPAVAGLFHELEAIQPQLVAKRRRIAPEHAAVQLETEHAQPVAQAQKAYELRVPRRFFLSGRRNLREPPQR